MRLFKTLLLAAAVAILSSCVKADDFRILEIEEYHLESLTKPVITLKVQNNSRRTVEILKGNFTLSSHSGKIADVMLTDVVSIPKKSVTSIRLPVRLKISNPLAAASILSGGGIDPSRLFISGEADVRAGKAKRTFTVYNSAISRFIGIFDPATNQPTGNYEFQL